MSDTRASQLSDLDGLVALETPRGGASHFSGIRLVDDHFAHLSEGYVALVSGMGPNFESAPATIHKMAREGCAAVVVNEAMVVAIGTQLKAAARESHITLYQKNENVSWLSLIDSLRHALRETGPGSERVTAGLIPGDLTTLAEALAQMVGGAVIIEDANFHVLAYSSLAGTIDPGRDAAILARRIPDAWLKHLEEIGALETLLTSGSVVDVIDGPYDARRRLLCAIRVDDQPLGILWVAEGSEPLRADIVDTMGEAARIAAPHLLRYQEEKHGQRSAQLRVLRTLMETGTLPRSTAEELGLVPAEAYAVVALRRTGNAGLNNAERSRIIESVDLFCQSYRWRSTTTAVGHTVYSLIALEPGQDLVHVSRLASGLATNSRRALVGRDMQVAISERSRGLASVPRLREQVDLVLDVMDSSANPAEPVLRYHDAIPRIVLDQLSDTLRRRKEKGYHKLDALLSHDAEHNTDYLNTARAYLGTFGSTSLAAKRLDLHVTTLRYRLRRIVEVCGLEFDDADERLLCTLLLRDEYS
ncbi:MAG: CdaR family transcriptional regulator [Homoserinimonas sp.]|nr:CdaR family transcriptional regulator [Homoserinimonas sp.]